MDETLLDNRRVFELLFQLGEAYLERKQFDEAIEKFEKLIELGEENRNIYSRLSEAYIQNQRFDQKAIQVFQKTLQYDPDNKVIIHILSQLYLSNNKEDDDAYQIYKKALLDSPNNSRELLTALIKIDYRNGNFHHVKSQAEQSLTVYPDHYEVIPYYVYIGWQEMAFSEISTRLKKIYKQNHQPLILKWIVVNYLKIVKNRFEKHQLECEEIELFNSFIKRNTQFDRLNDIYLCLAINNIIQASYSERITEKNPSISEYELFLAENSFSNIWERGLNKKIAIPRSFDFTMDIWNRMALMDKSAVGIFPKNKGNPTEEDFFQFNTIMIIQVMNYDELIEKGLYHDIIAKFESLIGKSLMRYLHTIVRRVNDGYMIFVNDPITAIDQAIDIFKSSGDMTPGQITPGIKFQIIVHYRTSTNPDKLLTELMILFEAQQLNDDILSVKSLTATETRDTGNKVYITEPVHHFAKNKNDYQTIFYHNINIPSIKKSIPVYEIAWEDPLEKLRNKTIAKIDRFHILNEIYLNDAMDSFKAVDTFLDRLVIMKILRPDFPTADRTKLSKLFLEKANIIGKLIHNNIAIIYDISENDGFCYIAREYVEGTQLTDLLMNTTPVSWRTALEICCQISEGLNYAHKLGVTHGRIKPNNVFISEMNEIKITDFTIPEFSTPIKTRKNLNLKGISYLAPEQIDNNGIDQRSDQFAVGVILYELLTNFNPFYAEDRDNLFDKIISFDPPPVSSFNMDVPQEVDMILNKALAKTPARRYEQIDQFLYELRKIARLK